MASLFTRNGWYYAQFFDAERSPTQKQVALRTKRRCEAERRLAAIEADVETGKTPGAARRKAATRTRGTG